MVTWLVERFQLSRNIAVDIGAKLMADGYISHVTEAYPFADDSFFYRFNYVILRFLMLRILTIP